MTQVPSLNEHQQAIIWLPVGIGSGVALYFGLPIEPDLQLTGAVLTVAAITVAIAWRRQPLRSTLILIVALAVGFAAADLRSIQVAAPVIAKRSGPTHLEATVVRTEVRERGGRITLSDLAITGGTMSVVPERVRITLRSGVPPPPGTRVKVRAILMPPPGPVAPGAFDFARQSWFKGIGAVGYALGSAEAIGSTRSGVAIWLASTRANLAARIRTAQPGPSGAIAAAS